jgi:hypothetical protein
MGIVPQVAAWRNQGESTFAHILWIGALTVDNGRRAPDSRCRRLAAAVVSFVLLWYNSQGK